jgi:hypothetical protein
LAVAFFATFLVADFLGAAFFAAVFFFTATVYLLGFLKLSYETVEYRRKFNLGF